MALQNFVDNSLPTIKAAFLNGLDILKTTIFDDAITKAQARTALGATTIGDAVFTAADQATAIAAIGAANAPVNTNITELTGLTTAIQLVALRGFIDGLILSNNVSDPTNDIDVSSGAAVDTTTTYLMELTGPFVKRLDAAWMAGSGNGGLDTGSIADAEYNVWLIRKDSDGTIDVLFSLSATAPTMPSGYTAKRRIGSIFRASATIRPFFQKANRVYFKTPVFDVDTTLGTTATSYTISVPGGSVAIVNGYGLRSGNTVGLHVYSPNLTDQAWSETASPLSNLSTASNGATSVLIASQIEVLTNSSAQIRALSQFASTTFRVATVGYIDTRGKDV